MKKPRRSRGCHGMPWADQLGGDLALGFGACLQRLRKAGHPQDGIGQVALLLPVSHAVTEPIDCQLHAKPVESAPLR
jgi:hypothetical protein